MAEVKKNNGLIKTGLSIPRDHHRVNPMIYLDGFAKEYEEGRGLNDIINEIIEFHSYRQVEEMTGISKSTLIRNRKCTL